MAREHPIELFMPPNMLKAKVGGGLGGMDMAAIKRAEEAMEALKSEFSDWIAEDVQALTSARARYGQKPDQEARAGLLRAAHDMKGQAATFDFPLIARVAGSLSRLIGELPGEAPLPLSLIDAHVSAIQVIHKQGLKDNQDPTAQALCTELDSRVEELLVRAGKA